MVLRLIDNLALEGRVEIRMYDLSKTKIYHALLNRINISNVVEVDSIELAEDFKRYARIMRGLDLEIKHENGKILIGKRLSN